LLTAEDEQLKFIVFPTKQIRLPAQFFKIKICVFERISPIFKLFQKKSVKKCQILSKT